MSNQNQVLLGFAAAAATYYFIQKDDASQPSEQPMNMGIAAAVGFAVSQSSIAQQTGGGASADGNQSMIFGAVAAAAAYMMLKRDNVDMQDQPREVLMALAFGGLVHMEMSGQSLLGAPQASASN